MAYIHRFPLPTVFNRLGDVGGYEHGTEALWQLIDELTHALDLSDSTQHHLFRYASEMTYKNIHTLRRNWAQPLR